MNRRHFITHAAGAVAILPRVLLAAAAPSPAKADSTDYAPRLKPTPVAKPGEFVFSAAHLDHPHINAQCSALIEAGGTLKWVYDADLKKVEAFRVQFPQVKPARALDEILGDAAVRLVAAAAIPSERGALGGRVMEAGKDYFTDKTPFTTLDQLDRARTVVTRTGRKYMVYYSERLHVESAMYATDLVQRGAIGKVVQVVSLAPHRLNKPSRPAWFFERAKYGGILCDVGSHQFEQFLTFAGAHDATVVSAAVGNYANPDKPEFEDFGEASLLGDNGATNYVRVDWFTPAGLGTLGGGIPGAPGYVGGDGRTFILGTKGYIELRKYVDVGREKSGNHVYLVNEQGEYHLPVDGKIGYRFFGELILDCLNRTEKAMTQAHAFKVAELSLKAQAAARRLT